MSLTPSQARRAIKVSLMNLIDRPLNPNAKQRIRKRFNNLCAYCGEELEERKAHFDHIVPIADQKQGSNQLNNFVVACNICNGDLKREQTWQEFLDLLVSIGRISAQDASRRKHEIESWISEAQTSVQKLDPSLKQLARTKTEEVIAAYTSAVEDIRKAARNS